MKFYHVFYMMGPQPGYALPTVWHPYNDACAGHPYEWVESLRNQHPEWEITLCSWQEISLYEFELFHKYKPNK
jgi:hypothetical protein